MNRRDPRPPPFGATVHPAPLVLDRRGLAEHLGLHDGDDLSSMRGVVAGIVLSAPLWAGLGYLTWKLSR